MEQTLKNKCVALLTANGFNPVHLENVKCELENAGAIVVLISASTATKVKSGGPNGDELFFDQPISNVCVEDYDVLFLPGGAESVQTLMAHDEARQFVSDFAAQNRPVAALGEAAQLLQEGAAGDLVFTAPAASEADTEAAAQEILRLFSVAPMTETQRRTA